MILEMKVPSPGESITEVEIAQWLVADGDYVEKDQAIAEVDSDKATLELPAEVSGTITLKAEEGDAVEVGQVVCLIDTEGQPAEGAAAPAAEVAPVEEAPKTPLPETPPVDPKLVSQMVNTNVMQTGLTPTETALLSNEEKVIRLKQRGMTT